MFGLFFFFFGVVGVALLVMIPIAFSVSLSNRRRIKELEDNWSDLVDRLEGRQPQGYSPPPSYAPAAPAAAAPPSWAEEENDHGFVTPLQTGVFAPSSSSSPGGKAPGPWETTRGVSFFSLMQENWLLAIGALFMLLAVGWLARYAFLHDIIGPTGRIVLGLALGLGVMALGQRRIRTHLDQGSIFATLGSGMVLLTIYAGLKYYSLFSPFAALALMFMTTALVAFISVRYQARRLSYAGLVMAAVIPLLVSTGSRDFTGLFTYLAVVTAGTLWVVYLTGWRKNVLIALAAVFCYSLPALANYTAWFDEPWIGLSFAFGFATVFFCVSLLGSLRSGGEERESDLAAAGLLGLFLIFWIVRVMPEEWRSLALVGWSLLFGMTSYELYVKTAQARFFYVYSAVSCLLLAAATAVQFSGPVMVLAFIFEAGLLPLALWKAMGDAEKTAKSTLVILVPAFMALESLSPSNWATDTLLHAHFFVTLMMVIVPLALVYLIYRLPSDSGEPIAGGGAAAGVAMVIATIYGGFLVWRVTHFLLDSDAARTVSLIIYMLTGLAAYIAGALRWIRPVKVYGGIIIGWVTFRLIFIDMPDMEVSGKIITFFVLGLLLLGTAFIEYKGKRDAA